MQVPHNNGNYQSHRDRTQAPPRPARTPGYPTCNSSPCSSPRHTFVRRDALHRRIRCCPSRSYGSGCRGQRLPDSPYQPSFRSFCFSRRWSAIRRQRSLCQAPLIPSPLPRDRASQAARIENPPAWSSGRSPQRWRPWEGRGACVLLPPQEVRPGCGSEACTASSQGHIPASWACGRLPGNTAPRSRPGYRLR